MTFKEEFSFDICDTNRALPGSIIGIKYYSYFNVIKEFENFNHSIYKIKCTIERDFYLNSYIFYLKYNKDLNYYILNDIRGNTVDNIYDMEDDYSIIEEPIMNIVLINICGHVPKLYFGDKFNLIYYKINKNINNEFYKISKKFKKEIKYLENYLSKNITLEDIKNNHIILYEKIQRKFVELFFKLDNKQYNINNVCYEIKTLNFDNITLNENYNFKIAKKNLKINRLYYLY